MVSPTAATFYFYKSFWSVLRSQALETPQLGFREPWVKWPQILLNLTWLCTKAFQTFSGTFSGTRLNLTWLCTKASCDLLRNLLRNSVVPDLALLRNLLRNPVEPDVAVHQSFWNPCWTWPASAPKPPRPSHEPSPEPCCCWTWPGSAPKPPRPSPEPSEPSPGPRWTWPGACTSAHRSYSGLKTTLAYPVGE